MARIENLENNFDEILGVEDVDVHDETSLRWLSDQVEKETGVSVRMSILNTEQWSSLLSRFLGSNLRGAAPHLRVIVDPQKSHHLIVSPSAVRGVGQMSGAITSEVVYALLTAMGQPLTDLWKRGVHQYLAGQVATNAKIRFEHNYHPREHDLIYSFVDILVAEHGYSHNDWYKALKRRPGSVFTALAKTKWTGRWIEVAKGNKLMNTYFKKMGYETINRDSFIKMLTAPDRQINDPFILFIIEYMRGGIARKN